MNDHGFSQPLSARAAPPPVAERRAQAQRTLAAARARARRIRRGVAAGAVASFVAAFAAVYVQMAESAHTLPSQSSARATAADTRSGPTTVAPATGSSSGSGSSSRMTTRQS